MNLREQMESIYQELPLDRIPWNLEGPPELLVDLIQTRKIAPCDAVDIGCGCGNYAVWLASQGFRMTDFGGGNAAVIDLAAARVRARQQRMKANRMATCGVCAGDPDFGALQLWRAECRMP
jgi:2-polyprenyl-3-methyl-5-hydroxy-6-metoxy-1,4-benzoquinol methylase